MDHESKYRRLRVEVSGHRDSNPEPRADLALTPFIRRLLFPLSYAPSNPGHGLTLTARTDECSLCQSV